MDKIIKNKNADFESQTIKTDISHIYALLKKNQGGDDGDNKGETSGSEQTEVARQNAISEKVKQFKYAEYSDLTNSKFSITETYRYNSIGGHINLPPIMFFHYTTADDTRSETYQNTFYVSAVVSAEESITDEVIFRVATKNTYFCEYKYFNFTIEPTGTICEFNYKFTDTQFRSADGACPFVIDIQSKSNKKIKCHILKTSVPFSELGEFSDKPNYVCHAVMAQALNRAYAQLIFPKGIPIKLLSIFKGDKVGYINKIKFRDLMDGAQLSKIYDTDAFNSNTTPLSDYDYFAEIDLPDVNAKDISCSRCGAYIYTMGGKDPRWLLFFYLTKEGYAMYKVYDVVEKTTYGGQICDGVYDQIASFDDAYSTPSGKVPLNLILHKAQINSVIEDGDEITLINFDPVFHRAADKQTTIVNFSLKDFGLEGFNLCYVNTLLTKDINFVLNIEAFNADFKRRNILVWLKYNTADNTYTPEIIETTNRPQLPGVGYAYSNYFGTELENGVLTYYVVTRSKTSFYANRRSDTTFSNQSPTKISQIIEKTSEFYCDIENGNAVVKFRNRSDAPSV